MILQFVVVFDPDLQSVVDLVVLVLKLELFLLDLGQDVVSFLVVFDYLLQLS